MKNFSLGSFPFRHQSENQGKETFSIDKILKDLDVGRVLLFIEGEEFLLDIKQVIRFVKNEDLITTNQIISTLDDLSSYRFSIVASISEFSKILSEIKLDLEIWENETKAKIAAAYISSSRITDKQTHSIFLNNEVHKNTYLDKSKVIFRIEALIFKLKALDEILRQRIEVLRSIMKRND